jgi:hypothetical protein
MPKDYTLTPKLRLILDHLKAVRTLNEYMDGVGLKKDMQDFANYLQESLSREVFGPAGWQELYPSKGCLYSSPQSKWRVVRSDDIAIEICPAWPVRNAYDSYVNLYVPPKWKKRQQFIAKLKAPAGFQHVSQSHEELVEETVRF